MKKDQRNKRVKAKELTESVRLVLLKGGKLQEYYEVTPCPRCGVDQPQPSGIIHYICMICPPLPPIKKP